MRLTRFVGFVDLGIAVVVLAMVALPPRPMMAAAAIRGGDVDGYALALAEARVDAHPGDPAVIGELARRLTAATFRDWAVEIAVRGSDRTRESPQRWRALLATSVAFIDRFDITSALDYANRAVRACEGAGEHCPSWEDTRLRQYQLHLQGSADSKINPWRDPEGFRAAGENALRQIRLNAPPPRQ